MDDIIQIIVILFFILSAFSGIFKKKKQQRQEMEKKTPSPKPSSKKTKDVFEELFGVKFPEEEESQVQTASYEKPISKETWDPESEFSEKTYTPQQKSTIEKKKPKIESQYKPTWQQVNYDKLSRSDIKDLEKDSNLIEKVKNKVFVNQKALEIKNKLDSQNTIREFILISEILNKPKALRR